METTRRGLFGLLSSIALASKIKPAKLTDKPTSVEKALKVPSRILAGVTPASAFVFVPGPGIAPCIWGEYTPADNAPKKQI